MDSLVKEYNETHNTLLIDSEPSKAVEHKAISLDQQAHNTNINNYYDSPAVQFFEQLSQLQIHLAYWDDKYPNVSFANAAKRLTTVIIDQLDVSNNSYLLDIGCGCGVPAMDIVKEKSCRVEGITINPHQQQKANSLALKTGLSSMATFRVADAANLPYPKHHFDSTLLLESIHHIGHREALKEAWRVLKPGGNILIADGVILKENVNSENQQTLSDTFVAKTLLTERESIETLSDIGFTHIETLDLTAAIQPTWKKLVQATQQNKSQIIQQNDEDFFSTMLDFWKKMDSIWTSSARYLIFKAYKN